MANPDRRNEVLAELRSKTLEEIQCETAFTWAYRAWGANKLNLAHDAVEYEHEAIEHAALTGDDRVLAMTRNIIAKGEP